MSNPPTSHSRTSTHASGARLKLQARLMLDDEIAFGPGKADLLDAIAATGSISAAGKHMGMSYRRAWLLVDAMNRCFQNPLVETATGGSHGGGTRLTAEGTQLLASYRQLQRDMELLGAKHVAPLKAQLRKKPLPSSAP